MATIVLRDPKITGTVVDSDGQGTPGSPVDLSCHIVTVTIDHEEEEVDVSTWCRPGATEVGPPAFSVDIDWKLQGVGDAGDTFEVAKAFIGKEIKLDMVANDGDTKQLTVGINFGQVNPAVIGTWTAGESVESSTSHGVVSDPTWTDVGSGGTGGS